MTDKSSSFDNMIAGFTKALENNTSSISEVLTILQSKKLSNEQKRQLNRITRDLKRIDNSLNLIGEE